MPTIEELKWTSTRLFRIEDTKEYRVARNGRRVRVTEGVEYVQTAGAGQMRLEDWYKSMEKAVQEEGKTELLDDILDQCRKLAWLRTEEDIRNHALECLSSEAYKHWQSNRKEAP